MDFNVLWYGVMRNFKAHKYQVLLKLQRSS